LKNIKNNELIPHIEKNADEGLDLGYDIARTELRRITDGNDSIRKIGEKYGQTISDSVVTEAFIEQRLSGVGEGQPSTWRTTGETKRCTNTGLGRDRAINRVRIVLRTTSSSGVGGLEPRDNS